MLTGLLTSAWHWVTAGAGDDVDIVQPTAAAAAAAAAVTSRQQPHRSHIVVRIYARTAAATDAVVKDIEKAIGEYLSDKVLDEPHHQQHIAKLTEQQVMLQYIAYQLLYCVRDSSIVW